MQNSFAWYKKKRENPPSRRSYEWPEWCIVGRVTHREQSHPVMKYVCDAPDRKIWFRIETEAEAEQESALMDHAVAKYFQRERENSVRSYKPTSRTYVERNIGLQAHIQREMPLFLTLRDAEGGGLVTAMLPPGGRDDPAFRIIIVGKGNSDPYPEHGAAIDALGAHFGLTLQRARCYPYDR